MKPKNTKELVEAITYVFEANNEETLSIEELVNIFELSIENIINRSIRNLNTEEE